MAADVTSAFVVIIRAMDVEYLEWQHKEQERVAGQKGKDQTGKGKGR